MLNSSNMNFSFILLCLIFQLFHITIYGKSVAEPQPKTEANSLNGLPLITIRGSHMSTSSQWPPRTVTYGLRSQPHRTATLDKTVPLRTITPTGGYYGYPGYGYGSYYGGYPGYGYGGYYGSGLYNYPYYGGTYQQGHPYYGEGQGYPQYTYGPGYAPGNGYYIQSAGVYPHGDGHYHGGIFGYDSPAIVPDVVNSAQPQTVSGSGSRPLQSGAPEEAVVVPAQGTLAQQQPQSGVSSPSLEHTLESPVEKSELTNDQLSGESAESGESGERPSLEDEENLREFANSNLDPRTGDHTSERRQKI